MFGHTSFLKLLREAESLPAESMNLKHTNAIIIARADQIWKQIRLYVSEEVEQQINTIQQAQRVKRQAVAAAPAASAARVSSAARASSADIKKRRIKAIQDLQFQPLQQQHPAKRAKKPKASVNGTSS
jgi:hypothetical protein